MKYIVPNILLILCLFSFVSADTPEATENTFPEHEQEMTIEVDNKELPETTTEEQRALRCQQKQMIKGQILELYKNLKEEKFKDTKKEKIKDAKKEIRSEIAVLKNQLRAINTKIAYSYKQQLKKFFGLK